MYVFISDKYNIKNKYKTGRQTLWNAKPSKETYLNVLDKLIETNVLNRRGRNRMVARFTNTCDVSVYHH
jgi:hypothetical protein